MTNKERLNKIKEILVEEDKAYNKRVAPLRAERDNIERETRLKDAQKLLGKCFRFRNGYGSGDKWWLYYKVISIDLDGIHDYKVISIQEPSYPELDIRIDRAHKGMFQEEVSKRQFGIVFDKAIKKLQQAQKSIGNGGK